MADQPRDPGLVSAAEQATRRAAAYAGVASDWDEAVNAWEAVLRAVERADVSATDRAVLFDRAAGVRLRRSQYGGPAAPADAAAAADGYRRAIRLVDPASPDRRAYLNNLGVALRTLWEFDRSSDALDDAIAAHEAAVAATSRDTPDGVTARAQLGAALRERHRELHCDRDLEAAVDALSEAVEGARVLGPEALAECHEALGNAQYDWYGVTGAEATLEESIRNLRAALELTPNDATDRDGYAGNLASALLTRFQTRGEREDLTAALLLFEEALEGSPGGPSMELLANLGNALSVRSVVDASRDDSDQAVAHLRRAVELAEGTDSLSGMLSNLAAALLERFDLTGQIVDIDEAVDILATAVDASEPDASARASRLNNLAIGLRRRQLRRRGGREDLDRAVAAYEEALSATPEADPDWPAYHANLGNVLHQRFDVTGDPEDLDRAVDHFETALVRTPKGSPDRPMYLNNLSATLSARAEHVDKPADLRRAAELLHEGLALTPESSVRRASLLVNLGNAESELCDRLGVASDCAAAQSAYRSATRDEIEASPADALAGARNWCEWAARRRAWPEAVEAYSLGEEAAQRLFRAQLVRSHKESWLRDADGLAAVGALAHAARSELADAALALELGRARLYAERLEREHADLRRLQADREELALRYRTAAAHLGVLEGGDDGIS
jgi:tetratricopeptide (TPR) repeat protein